MRAGAPPPISSCLQSAAHHHHHHPIASLSPSCSPEVQLDRSNMHQLIAFCMIGSFGLCVALAELSRLFWLFSKPQTYLPSFPFCPHPPSEYPWTFFFAGSSMWASGGRRRWRPSTQTMRWTTFKPCALRWPPQRWPDFSIWTTLRMSPAQANRPSQQNMSTQKAPRSSFPTSLVLCNSGSLNLAALDISQDNQSFRGLKTRLPKPH